MHTKSHRPSAMTIAHLTKKIHAEPYISRIQFKFRVGSIYFSLLRPISGVSQHRVLLAFHFVPSHQLRIIFISKQTLQTWYYRRIPHDLSRNSLPGTLPLDIARIIFYDLVTQCSIRGMHPNSHTRLGIGCSRWGHVCIFCTSNPRGQTSVWLHTLW